MREFSIQYINHDTFYFRLVRCTVFRRHLKSLNVDINHGQEEKSTKERKFKCTECDFACSAKSHLDSHTRKHRGEKPFQCTLCHKYFSQTGNLNKHIRQVIF